MPETPAEQEEARQEKLRRQQHGDDGEGAGDGGEVAEVGQLDESEAGDPIYPDQAVAGSPDSESGGPDEGPAGPNATPAAGPTTDENG